MSASWLLLLFFCLSNGDALKILVNNPAIAPSHVEFHRAIIDVLTEAGHTVHVFVPVFDFTLMPKKSMGVTKVYEVHAMDPVPLTEATFKREQFDRAAMKNTFTIRGESYKSYLNTSTKLCDVVLANDAMLAEMKAEKYDVVLSEFYDFCFFGVFHAVGIKTMIITSATPINELISYYYGIPSPRSYVTNTLSSYSTAPQLSYFQRIDNLYNSIADYFVMKALAAKTNAKLQRKFGPTFAGIEEIMLNTSLSFVNAAYMLDLPRPTTHKVINIGGVNVKTPKKSLDPSIAAVFKKAKKGVVLVSFGSLAESDLMKVAMKEAFIRSFAAFPDVEFIWKFTPANANESQRLDSHGNIHPVDWMDQTTILNQPKLRAFITHCGLNSITESVHAGKPMIAIPLFADQDYNAAIVSQRRVGVFVEIATVDETTMTAALRQVLEDAEFYENAQLLRRKMLMHPNDPRTLVVKWVEYAAEFGDLHEHLNLESVGMDYFTYFCLDIIVPGIFVAVSMLFVFVRVAALAFRQLSSLLEAKRKAD